MVEQGKTVLKMTLVNSGKCARTEFTSPTWGRKGRCPLGGAALTPYASLIHARGEARRGEARRGEARPHRIGRVAGGGGGGGMLSTINPGDCGEKSG